MLTEVTLDDIGYQPENSLKRTLRYLSQQMGFNYTSVQETMKLFKLKPYEDITKAIFNENELRAPSSGGVFLPQSEMCHVFALWSPKRKE